MQPPTTPFAFFGTPYVARDTLKALIDAGYRPKVVITSPDAARGRGMAISPCATKEFALAEGLPVLTPDTLDDFFLSDLARYVCTYGIAVAYGKILPQKVIDLFPLGILNVHYSLLPQYRGASPVEAALLAGQPETGVTIQQMVLKMDAGDILAQESAPVAYAETVRELRPRLITLGSKLLIKTLPAFIGGTASRTPQNEAEASFAPKVSKDEGMLSLYGSPEMNWQKYRAFLESPGTYFFATKDDKRIRVKIADATFENGAFVIERIVPEGKNEQPFSWVAQNGWQPE